MDNFVTSYFEEEFEKIFDKCQRYNSLPVTLILLYDEKVKKNVWANVCIRKYIAKL